MRSEWTEASTIGSVLGGTVRTFVLILRFAQTLIVTATIWETAIHSFAYNLSDDRVKKTSASER